MTIGELIDNYCKHTGVTNQRFAEMCGVSKGYVSQLINGRNPKTGKPITPTIETYIKIAQTMNKSLDDLFRQLDDAPIALKKMTQDNIASQPKKRSSESRERSGGEGPAILSSVEYALICEVRDLSEAGRMEVLQFAQFIREKEAKEMAVHED